MNPPSAERPSTPTTTYGTTRRLSILRKFGNCLVKGMATTSTTPSSEMVETKGEQDTEGGAKTSMLPPPPPLLPSSIMGAGNAVGSGGSNMRKLLEDLHQSRVCFEMDQQALNKTTLDLKDIDSKISNLTVEADKANEKFKTLAEVAAYKRTELNSVEIKNKIVDKTLKKVEEELSQVVDELHQLRIQTSALSTSYLNEAVQFGLQWNGTELGRENRIHFDKQELENLERQKRQLEFELADFLVLQKGVKECEEEVQDLSERYKQHDAAVSKQEMDLQTRIDELNMALKDLEYEEKEFKRTSLEEMEQLQFQINEIQSSINSLQNQSVEAKNAVKTQKTCYAPKKASSAMSPDSMRDFATNSKPFESKPRSTRFQVPIRPQLQNQSNIDYSNDCTGASNYFSRTENCDGGFTNSENNSNDEDMCLVAAAAEVSQSLRDYETIAPTPNYTHKQGPTPAKVRAMDRQFLQTPITAFMKQLSSAKVIKRPSKSSAASQGKSKNSNKPCVQAVAPVRTSLPLSGKTFQFKKKLSCSDLPLRSCENDESTFVSNNNSIPQFYDDRPFSRFNSSRVLLTESQEERLQNCKYDT